MDRIAHIENDLWDKFGIPRQSGIVEEVKSTIVFEPQYRNPDALRGLEDFSHIWLIWVFDIDRAPGEWTATVRPPRLGGNERKGVFATRSPFRPNPIGLSCVRLLGIKESDNGLVLEVAGADLRNGTAILDIKPYLPFADSHPDAIGGFADSFVGSEIKVECPPDLLCLIPEEKQRTVLRLLSQDPRPSYHNDPNRIYGMSYANLNIRFQVKEDVLLVTSVEEASS